MSSRQGNGHETSYLVCPTANLGFNSLTLISGYSGCRGIAPVRSLAELACAYGLVGTDKIRRVVSKCLGGQMLKRRMTRSHQFRNARSRMGERQVPKTNPPCPGRGQGACVADPRVVVVLSQRVRRKSASCVSRDLR